MAFGRTLLREIQSCRRWNVVELDHSIKDRFLSGFRVENRIKRTFTSGAGVRIPSVRVTGSVYSD